MHSRRFFLRAGLGAAALTPAAAAIPPALRDAQTGTAPAAAARTAPTQVRILYIGGGRLAQEEAESWATVSPVGFDAGTPHLEYEFYEHLAIHQIIKKAVKAEQDGFDAVVIGCFYDPGLREARELVRIPVVGVCEASVGVASMLCAAKFSILVGRRKWIPKMSATTQNYGFESRIASWRVLDLTVPDMRDKVKTEAAIYRESKRAIEEDSAEAIVLGCTGMAGQARNVQQRLQVPVLDPVLMGLRVAELRAILWKRHNVSHSKLGGYEPPPPGELEPIFKKVYGIS